LTGGLSLSAAVRLDDFFRDRVHHIDLQDTLDLCEQALDQPEEALADVEAKVTTAVQQFKVAHPTWPNE
jgi:predicted YcjX-like family ATPase